MGSRCMSTVVCIGGGRFGSKAAIASRRSNASVLVIDNSESCQARMVADLITSDVDSILYAAPGEVRLFIGEGVSTLDDILARWVPNLVVPASKGHLAAHLAVEHCRRQGRILAPIATVNGLAGRLPPRSVIISDDRLGVVVTSHMPQGRMCQEDCEQPQICPVSGTLILTPMHRSIDEALSDSVDWQFVLATAGTGQFGGIKGPDLKVMLAALDDLEEGATCGIATACRCHGIINLFRMLD